jgi:alpha-methylacyl-CoA racemase
VLGMQGPQDGPPQVPGFQLADIGGGLWCVVAVLAALQERSRTGKGKVMDVAMLEGSMGFASAAFGQLLGGATPRRGAEALTGGLAIYATYRTRDGRYVAFGALEPKFWQAFCAGAGLAPDMSAFLVGPHQTALKEQLRALFASRTRAEWESFGRQHDCCLEPVLEPRELRDDEQLRARRVFFEIDSPWGRLSQLRTPVTPLDASHSPPPRKGEHTDAILREAGLDDAAIAALRADGVAA